MWDDDDFDPTAQINERVADAVAVVGIVEEKKELAAEEKPTIEKASTTKPKAVATTTNKAFEDLSKAEIEELQKRNDLEMFADVLGVEIEDKNAGGKNFQEEVVGDDKFEALEKELSEKVSLIEEKASTKPHRPLPAKQQKKKVNKAVYDDYVDDEYDAYDDKFNNY